VKARCVFCLLLLSGCTLPGQPNPEDRPLRPSEVRDFGTLFQTHCAGCHGANGELGPGPPLNDPLFLKIVPDEVLEHVIADGRKGTLMPAFSSDNGGPLTPEQVTILAEGLKPHWSGPREVDKPPPYEDPTPGDPKAGREVFKLACAICHGDNGEGGASDKPIGAINDPAFLALMSDQVLRRYIITGRPDLRMPAFDSSDWRDPKFETLTSKQINDVVALLAEWRKTP